jgi:MoaA/NifB/PqqE/SkfB family radical SAM enzyme
MNKINIFLNNIFPRYNQTPMSESEYVHASLKHVKRVIKDDDTQYILRGEPTLYPYLYEVLDALQGKNFVLTTSGYNPDVLFRYKGKIPYLSLNYDGFINDKLRNANLSRNIIRILDFYGQRDDMTTRIQYTISKMNLPWIKADAEILLGMYAEYKNIKKPYFIIYQQTEIFNQEVFTWVGLGPDTVKMLNHKGLLSKKNLAFMNAWMDKVDYDCVAPRDEMVMAWDGTFRMCMSMRFGQNIGNIEEEPIEEIIESTEDMRAECSTCAFRSQCWLAFHFKDNIKNLKNLT